MAYGPYKTNRWLKDPKGDDAQLLSPAPATMSDAVFEKFFLDFTTYIREGKDAKDGMPGVIMTKDGIKVCVYWADLVLYVFDLQS
jgi:hypothetical protein